MTMYFDPAQNETLSIYQIRRKHNNISFPSNDPDLTTFGYYKIEEVEKPTNLQDNQTITLGTPIEYQPGKYKQNWVINTIDPIPAPETITKLQLRLRLLELNNWNAFYNYVNSLDRTEEEKAYFEDALEYEKSNQYIVDALTAANIVDIDDFFITANNK